MEHVEDPNGLMSEIASYCARHGVLAIISVPFSTERETLRESLAEPDPLKPPNPFRMVEGHINHFTHSSFQDLAKRHGAWHVEHFPFGWMHNYWLEFGS